MLRLELDELSLDLDDIPPPLDAMLHVTEVDWGFPEIRAVAEAKVGRSGEIDKTKHTGPRVITITGKLALGEEDSDGRDRWHQRDAVQRSLGPFLSPRVRPYLYGVFAGVERRIQVRADDVSWPEQANVIDWSINFKAPDGLIEGPLNEVYIAPEIPLDGFEFDIPNVGWPSDVLIQFPPGDATFVMCHNNGTELADWTAKIYGPCLKPELVNLTTGERVSLSRNPSWIPQGQYVEVSSADHTVLMGSLRENSRWGWVDFEASDWWQLPPGPSAVQMKVEDWVLPAHTAFSWRDAYLL